MARKYPGLAACARLAMAVLSGGRPWQPLLGLTPEWFRPNDSVARLRRAIPQSVSTRFHKLGIGPSVGEGRHIHRTDWIRMPGSGQVMVALEHLLADDHTEDDIEQLQARLSRPTLNQHRLQRLQILHCGAAGMSKWAAPDPDHQSASAAPSGCIEADLQLRRLSQSEHTKDQLIRSLSRQLASSHEQVQRLKEQLSSQGRHFERELLTKEATIRSLELSRRVTQLQAHCRQLYIQNQPECQKKLEQVAELARRQPLYEVEPSPDVCPHRGGLDHHSDEAAGSTPWSACRSLDATHFAGAHLIMDARPKLFRHSLQAGLHLAPDPAPVDSAVNLATHFGPRLRLTTLAAAKWVMEPVHLRRGKP